MPSIPILHEGVSEVKLLYKRGGTDCFIWQRFSPCKCTLSLIDIQMHMQISGMMLNGYCFIQYDAIRCNKVPIT